jgi:GT2 family glycosyltransferase
MITPVNVIIPVYRGLNETIACLNSILNSPQQISFHITVINDCSPESNLVTYLNELAASNTIQLLHNNENLGFVATVNLGMQQHPECDVVLLNNDTVVANNWLDRLCQCAYSQERIASVSPFSNNATICSYPRCCQDNSLPTNINLIELDNCFAMANAGKSLEIPTTVGFCMYIRRTALNEIGLFDATTFGKGYGEENDFCMRAKARGWRHLLCADTFVYHAGNVSFGNTHDVRKLAAMQILRQRYPHYETLVMEHIYADPAQQLRLRAAFAYLRLQKLPLILVISHNRHGGTLRHIQELTRNLDNLAHVLFLTPTVDGAGGVEVQFLEHFSLFFQLDQDISKLVGWLSELRIQRIHVHHTLGLPPVILGLAAQLGIKWDFTVHDYYSICPQINLVQKNGQYCGEPTIEECQNCLKLRPAPGRVSIQQWRNSFAQLLNTAERCFTPSQDCTQRMQRYFPHVNWQTVYHESQTENLSSPKFINISNTDNIRILIIGALSVMKGADVLEDVAYEAKTLNLPITFTLLGYAYRNLAQIPDTKLKVHGPYTDQDLPNLIQNIAPHIIWFPALWPETYSYTLSAALNYAAPIVAPKLGAFTERLAGRELTWLVPWDWTPTQFNQFFLQLKYGSWHDDTVITYAATREPKWNQVANFNYQRDYLSMSDKISPQILNKEMIENFVERYVATRQTLSTASRIRGLALKILVYLRAAPLLSPLVRKIPAAWQTWAKNFLLRG